MASDVLKCPSKVECIRKKFESTVFTNSDVQYTPAISPGSDLKSFELKKDSVKTISSGCKGSNSSNCGSKILIKRSPAFRCEKVKGVKTIGKFRCLKQEPIFDTLQNQWEKKSDSAVIHQYSAVKSKYFDASDSDSNSIEVNDNVNEKITSHSDIQKPLKYKCKEIKFMNSTLELSESLKKALQSPLPKGPPPKKPPRSFGHLTCSPNLHKNFELSITSKDLPDLQLKLKKLENVIRNHDKSNVKTNTSGTLKNIVLSKENQFLPNVFRENNQICICFKLPSCVNTSQDKSIQETECSSINEKNTDLKSEKWILNEGVTCHIGDELMKKSDLEPIYDLPLISKSYHPISQNLIQINKFCADENESEGLHYLCTDIVNRIIHLRPNVSSEAETSLSKPGNPEGDNSNKFLGSNEKFSMLLSSSSNIFKKKKVNLEGSSLFYLNAKKRVNSPAITDKENSFQSNSVPMTSSVPDTFTSKFCSLQLDVNKAETPSKIIAKSGLCPETPQIEDPANEPSKIFQCFPNWKITKENNCSRLYECCLLVGLTLESKRTVPYVKNIFPPNVKPPPFIEALCFPDAANWPLRIENDQEEEQYYSLVVTSETGDRKFGYCRRVLPEGSNLCLPLAYCIITSHRANGFFYKILQELESRHGSQEIENFIEQLYEARFPGPGEGLKLEKILEEAPKISFSAKNISLGSTLIRRPCDTRLEDKNLTQLFHNVKLSVFFKIFSSLLSERKVLLLSSSLRKLSSSIEGLQSIILPFSWQHTCIPVLPVHLLEMCEAPTPYMVGLLKTERMQGTLTNLIFENGVMVDLDDSRIIKMCGDEDNVLPPRLIKSLKTSLNSVISATTLSDSSRNVLISDALIKFFVEVCGHYSKFLSLHQGKKAFMKKDFIKRAPSASIQSFLEWFTETAMFQAFIHERLNGNPEDTSVKLFSLRAMESSSEALKNSPLAINYKVLNKKVKNLSGKIKDFIQ